MSRDQWAQVLEQHFAGTKYAADKQIFWQWLADRVGPDDDPDDVAAAWMADVDKAARGRSQAFGGSGEEDR